MYREQLSPKLANGSRLGVEEEADRGPVSRQDEGRSTAITQTRGGLWISFSEGWRAFWECGALI